MKYNAILTWIYASILLIGGIIGYLQANSLMSLLMGVLFSTLLDWSGFLMFQGKRIGYPITLFLVCLLAAFFSYRFALTGKFIPAGMMILFSAILGLFLLWRRRK